jgi:hypothetical protein
MFHSCIELPAGNASRKPPCRSQHLWALQDSSRFEGLRFRVQVLFSGLGFPLWFCPLFLGFRVWAFCFEGAVTHWAFPECEANYLASLESSGELSFSRPKLAGKPHVQHRLDWISLDLNMCIYIYIIYIYIIYIYICYQMYVCMYICIYLCIYVSTYLCMYVMYVCMYISMYLCIYVCM